MVHNASLKELFNYIASLGFNQGANQDNLRYWLASLGYNGALNDSLYKYLRGQGYSGALNDMLETFLRAITGSATAFQFSDNTTLEFTDSITLSFGE